MKPRKVCLEWYKSNKVCRTIIISSLQAPQSDRSKCRLQVLSIQCTLSIPARPRGSSWYLANYTRKISVNFAHAHTVCTRPFLLPSKGLGTRLITIIPYSAPSQEKKGLVNFTGITTLCCRLNKQYKVWPVINARRACARGLRYLVCVCVCVRCLQAAYKVYTINWTYQQALR